MRRLLGALFILTILGAALAHAQDTSRTYNASGELSLGNATSSRTLTRQTISGVPPIGYASGSDYIPVTMTTPLPVQTAVGLPPYLLGGTATSSYLDTAHRLLVNIGSHTTSLPTGTNILGKVGVDQTTNGTTNAVVPKIYDGSTYTAMPGTASGVYVMGNPLMVASCTVGSITTGVGTIALKTGTQELTISLTQNSKEAWALIGGDSPSVGNGIPFRTSISFSRLNPNEVIKVIASETLGAVWTQR